MGIIQTCCNNNKNKIKGDKYKQNAKNLDISKTVRMFDYNSNKYVDVPVLEPATLNSLYSKRQTQSSNITPAAYLSQS
ncbi:unnamed protein product (macronuclear) [Paramecium tetraurelia]|uniref:Uncharacterized protein n=1 Tax=Paramecium tetraurelia TaxID=5888 RepID=A0BJK6_PARTE|nr:uncharacterized protein GSPATT00029351001 [Paramecium tetraurelia]CAK58723.1 unnamed protein product [Paramecium tetraurelia]|eukprot:XP_001426121.1 hypothetical protein (macronuclear) [Paramecium tetraurelia strain d4-2]